MKLTVSLALITVQNLTVHLNQNTEKQEPKLPHLPPHWLLQLLYPLQSLALIKHLGFTINFIVSPLFTFIYNKYFG